MSNPSLHNKTIRPGSLSGYSYYYSNRQAPTPPPQTKDRRKVPPIVKKFGLTAAVIAVLLIAPILMSDRTSGPLSSTTNSSDNQPATAAIAPPTETKPALTQEVNHCAGNTKAKFIKVSISQRHLWACEGEKEVHDAPVITGMLKYPETLTPPGTYTIYGKMQDTRLTGADSAGAWNYPVSYWMPFLDNQYGTYGFHDATWRPDSDFGNTDANGDKASHGCIELTLGSAKWLYDWAPVKTTLTVES